MEKNGLKSADNVPIGLNLIIPEEWMQASEVKEKPVPLVESNAGRVVGQSTMISLIRYDEAAQSLYLRLLDGQELTYRDVPPVAYSQLISDSNRVDLVYRFKIQGAYKSLPPDSTVVRKYYKWQRRNRAEGEVRVIENE